MPWDQEAQEAQGQGDEKARGAGEETVRSQYSYRRNEGSGQGSYTGAMVSVDRIDRQRFLVGSNG